MTLPSNLRDEPIAIVGMSCDYPQAPDLLKYWELLSQGINAISEVPKDRWNVDYFYDPEPGTPGKMNTRWGGFITTPYEFDFSFFNLSRRQASKWDPQHRWLLESSWRAFESAGLTLAEIKKSNGGVYVGIGGQDYAIARVLNANQSREDLANSDIYTVMGSNFSVAVNRLSRFYHLRGPSLAINTDCSSSLVAAHLACEHLKQGTIDLALVGGVRFIGSPIERIGLSQAWLVSSENCCRSFDVAADGYVLSEGHGCIILKRLSDAVANGDCILATIVSSAINSDCVHQEIVQPSAESMVDVMHEALELAKLHPQEIHYIEGHGVASPKADFAELEALLQVFDTERSAPCLIGTAKSNLGHMQWGAGVASIIKVVLSMHYGKITPVLNFQSPVNDALSHTTNIKVVDTLCDWPSKGELKTAGINSFGLGGSNAHLILQEYPFQRPTTANSPWPLLTISAASEKAVLDLAVHYAQYLKELSEEAFFDACYTINAGRNPFAYRISLFAKTSQELLNKLNQVDSSAVVYSPQASSIVWMFTGQGSQYKLMGKALYDKEPVYRQTLEQCAKIADPLLEKPLLEVIFNDENALNQTLYTQPALFALEYSLAELLKSWGLKPDYVMGHSLGEYTAACVAGLWSLEDGLKIVIKRAQLIYSLPQIGKMLAVFAPLSAIEELIVSHREYVSIASYNTPEQIVFSGDSQAIEALAKQLELKEIEFHYLTVSHAFHSHLMEPILDEFEAFMQSVTYRPLQIPLISNIKADTITTEELGATYWKNHIRQPVRFEPSMQTLKAKHCTCFLEIGPHPILTGLSRNCLSETDNFNPQWFYLLKRSNLDGSLLHETLGKLFELGFAIDWKAYYRSYACLKDPFVPTYPFQREAVEPQNIPDLSYQHAIKPSIELEKVSQELPTSIVERKEFLKAQIRAQLNALFKADHISIKDDTSFFDLGIDSLTGIELINRLQAEFKGQFTLTPTILFEHPTLEQLSDYLSRLNTAFASSNQAAPYRDIELQLSPALKAEMHRNLLVPKQDIKDILITGITGFVGPYLVEELFKQNPKLKFYCLVRAKSLEEAKKRIEKNFENKKLLDSTLLEHIIPLAGDFSAPLFGQTLEVYEELCERIDAVFHIGAQVNFILPYSALYQSNVQSVQEIIRFCIHRKIKYLHHISTIAAFPLFYSRALKIEETDDLQPNWTLDYGYAQTKYAAEQLVKQAQALGLPASIYRLGGISGDSQTGAWDTEDALPEVLRGCLELGTVPNSLHLSIPITPVDYIGKAIASIVMSKETGAGIFHITNPQQTRFGHVLDLLAQTYNLKQVSEQEWLSLLKQLAAEKVPQRLIAHIPFFEFLEKLTKEKPYSTHFLTHQTKAVLQQLGISCPRMNKALWLKYFKFLNQ